MLLTDSVVGKKASSCIAPEGTVFSIPLRDHGFGIGVLARPDGKGICYGYFFGPRLDGKDSVNVDNLFAKEAMLIGKFGDHEIIKGGWKSIGLISDWKKKMGYITLISNRQSR